MNEVPLGRILIADDEPLYLRTTGDLLRQAGYECVCVPDGATARARLAGEEFDLILSDLNMPGNHELELLHEGRRHRPDVPLIVITGVPSLPTAIESIRLGIADYLLKPVKFDVLLACVRRVINRPHSDAPQAGREFEHDEAFDLFPNIVGRSRVMGELFEVMERVADSDANVLISGESGTGKEVAARAIHDHSRRANRAFQVIDCTAIPESLFESLMFGHAKGAFTGAVKDQPGLLSLCDGGTAFLDEIGELASPLQSKLLRVVQEQSFIPVGENRPVSIDTRFICATNRDLEQEVNAGRFRRDLYYRLAVIPLEMPPLRDREDDAVLLSQHFLKQLARNGARATEFAESALSLIRRSPWPGNIRELRNAVEHALALSRSATIEADDLPGALRAVNSIHTSSLGNASRDVAIDLADREYLKSLLVAHAGNVSSTARQAGMSRQGMHKLLKKHGLSAAEFRERDFSDADGI